MDLKPLNLANLRPIGHAVEGAVGAGLVEDKLIRHKYVAQKHLQSQRIANATKLLARLPEEGEIFTLLLSGTIDGWDFIPAVLALAAPATIAELYVATLGFGDANSGSLAELLDAGKIKRVWFLASCYMRDASGKRFEVLNRTLSERGQRCKAIRNHAKVLAILLTDGRKLVIDGSLNFCGSKNIEQANVWGNGPLYDFYRDYIREQCEKEGETK